MCRWTGPPISIPSPSSVSCGRRSTGRDSAIFGKDTEASYHSLRSSGRCQRFLVAGRPRGSRCAYCAGPGHLESRADLGHMDRLHKPRTALAYHYSMDYPRRRQHSDVCQTYGFLPRPQIYWLRSKQTKHWTDHGGCRWCGYWQLQEQLPKPRLVRFLVSVPRKIGWSHHLALQRDDSQVHFHLPT